MKRLEDEGAVIFMKQSDRSMLNSFRLDQLKSENDDSSDESTDYRDPKLKSKVDTKLTKIILT